MSYFANATRHPNKWVWWYAIVKATVRVNKLTNNNNIDPYAVLQIHDLNCDISTLILNYIYIYTHQRSLGWGWSSISVPLAWHQLTLRIPWLGASEPREGVTCCRSVELLLILPTHRGMAGLSLPTATVLCENALLKGIAQWLTDPVTVRLRIQRTTTGPPHHIEFVLPLKWLSQIFKKMTERYHCRWCWRTRISGRIFSSVLLCPMMQPTATCLLTSSWCRWADEKKIRRRHFQLHHQLRVSCEMMMPCDRRLSEATSNTLSESIPKFDIGLHRKTRSPAIGLFRQNAAPLKFDRTSSETTFLAFSNFDDCWAEAAGDVISDVVWL